MCSPLNLVQIPRNLPATNNGYDSVLQYFNIISCITEVSWNNKLYLQIVSKQCNFFWKLLGRCLKKKSFYPHFVDKRLPPHPLIHVGGFYKNIIKFKYYPHRLTPPPPPALIHISNFYNIFFKLFSVGIFSFFSSVLCRNRPNTTKYALQRPNNAL